VCADSRYKLYVNGTLIGRGPARSFPEWQHYDEYDLAAYLKPGRNVIAALVHHYGEANGQYILGRGAFLFDSEVASSDDSWRVLPAEAWHRDLPMMTGQIGFNEVYDANKAPDGWTEPGYDDSAWETSAVIGPVGTPPWTRLIPREIPFLPEAQIYPARVLQAGLFDASEVDLGDDVMNIAKLMAEEKKTLATGEHRSRYDPLAVRPQIDDLLSGKVSPGGPKPVSLEAPSAQPGTGPFLALDFGKEVMGYPNFTIWTEHGGTVDMGYSERLEDGLPNPFFGTIRYADRIILKPGESRFETFDKRAFRYMQLDFRDIRGRVRIDSIGLKFSTYPVRWRGSFECSDARLNEIWKMGAYTVQLNMEDGYTDCPWRERAQWWGDARVEALINYYAFGDTALIRNGLKEIARSQLQDGMTACFAPGNPDLCGNIPSFTLIWILSIWDYYRWTCEEALVRELYPSMKRAIGFFESKTDDDELVSNTGYWMFIDWAEMDLRGTVTSLNCFYYGALLDAVRTAELVGEKSDAERYTDVASRLKAAINRKLWDAKKGVYADCLAEGTLSEKVSQQTNSLAVLFDIAPREKWNSILDYIHDPVKEVVQSGTPYFSFYVLHALWHAGRDDQAFAYIRRMWGRMLDEGATTCWETWGLDSHSLCHGWSGAPTHDLPAFVLGVHQTEPGFAKFLVRPRPFDLTWARGTIPTVKGDIRVEWTREKGFDLTVNAPEGTTYDVILPEEGKD
jgi:hypothetical protein